MKLWFDKWEATGNDFIVVDLRQSWAVDFKKIAPHLCNRRKGIGADGILLIEKPKNPEEHFFLRVINADGSEAEMSGNGIRCACGWWLENTPFSEKEIRVGTLAGLKKVFPAENGKFKVDMGEAKLLGRKTFDINGKKFEFFEVNVGNPHLVFIGDFSDEDFELAGQKLSQNWNLEFVKEGGGSFSVRVWERGVGETLACGTGATAVSTVLFFEGKISGKVELEFKGGKLWVEVEKVGGEKVKAVLEGEARKVFSGYIELS